jgi:hypothetical protein
MSLRGKPSKVVRPVRMFTPCCAGQLRSSSSSKAHCETDRIEHLAQRLELRLQPVFLRHELLQGQLLLRHAVGVAARHGAGAYGGCVYVVHHETCVCFAAIFWHWSLARQVWGCRSSLRRRGADPPEWFGSSTRHLCDTRTRRALRQPPTTTHTMVPQRPVAKTVAQ